MRPGVPRKLSFQGGSIGDSGDLTTKTSRAEHWNREISHMLDPPGPPVNHSVRGSSLGLRCDSKYQKKRW